MNIRLFRVILATHVQLSLRDAHVMTQRRNFPLTSSRINLKFPLCSEQKRRYCIRQSNKAENLLPGMRSPCSPRIVKLRERNRILLDQLESNSLLLERRLEKLKRFVRTVRYSDKSWQTLPPSPLKRKYESWKTRNYSGQVSAAVNAHLYSLSSSSSDGQELELKYRRNVENIKSSTKRIKQNTPIVSRPKNKEIHLCECCQNPIKSFTATDLTNDEKVCEGCYFEDISGKDIPNSDVTSQDSEGSMPTSHTDKGQHKGNEPPQLHSSNCQMYSDIIDNEQQGTLEAADAIINYSPESVFLQRFKERSRAVGDVIAPGKIRTLAKPSSVTPTKKLHTNHIKSAQPIHDKFSPLRSHHSVRHSFDRGHRELISSEHQQCTTGQPLHHSPRLTFKDEVEHNKNRKHCLCCVQQNIQSRQRFPTVTQEKEEEKLVDEQGLANPETSPLSCYRCCCDGTSKKISAPKFPLIASDIVAALLDNEHDKKYVQPGRQDSKWFHELNEYRQLHWFDCHAHTFNSCTNEDNARNLDKGTGLRTGHKCLHKYVLDDRLFTRPLYSDHHNNSRCVVCHLPYNLFKSGMRESPVITLPSTLPDPEIQVSIPVRSPCGGTRPSVSGNILSHKKVTRSAGRGRGASGPRSRSQPSLFMHTVGDLTSRAPPPADSWALRYQKGVAK